MEDLTMVERLRGSAGVKQRNHRLRAHGVQCALCKRLGAWSKREASASLPLLVVDHIVPLAKGGTDDDSNTRVICEPCHRDVTAEQFGHRKRVAVDRWGWPLPDATASQERPRTQ